MKILIAKSGLHGKGLFASRNIKRGEVVFIIKGEKVNFLIDSTKKAAAAGLNWVGVGKNQWIDPINHCVFFNHSCDPNTGIKGRVTVVALRNIKKGEEVTFDYSLNEGDIFWRLKCNCGHKNCRKVIRSIQFVPKNIFEKRKSVVPRYYKKVFDRFHISKFKNEAELRKNWISFIRS